MNILQVLGQALPDATRAPQGRQTLPAPLGSQVPPQAALTSPSSLLAKDYAGTLRREDYTAAEMPDVRKFGGTIFKGDAPAWAKAGLSVWDDVAGKKDLLSIAFRSPDDALAFAKGVDDGKIASNWMRDGDRLESLFNTLYGPRFGAGRTGSDALPQMGTSTVDAAERFLHRNPDTVKNLKPESIIP